LCATIFCFSCKDALPVTGTADDAATMKSRISKEASEIVWTTEIEGERLSVDITKMNGISDKLKLSPEVLAVSGAGDPLYPSFDDFGSLDISKLDSQAVKTVNGFCAAVSKGTEADSFLLQKAVYTLVLFLSDIKLQWPGYPSEFSDQNPLFVSWIPGEPFAGSADFIVPVRLRTADNCTLDLQLFLDRNQDWKIERIHILKVMEKQS
jgi:hypothetical protein